MPPDFSRAEVPAKVIGAVAGAVQVVVREAEVSAKVSVGLIDLAEVKVTEAAVKD